MRNASRREFVGRSPSHGTTTAMVFGSHFAGATAALFDDCRKCGMRIVSGLVMADRIAASPNCTRRRSGLSRLQSADRTLSRRKGLALCGHAALRALHVRGDARGLPGAVARSIHGPPLPRRTSTRTARSRRKCAAVSMGRRLSRGLRALRLVGRTSVAHNVHASRSELAAHGRARGVDRALPIEQCRARQRDLSDAAASRGGRALRAWVRMSAEAPGSAC